MSAGDRGGVGALNALIKKTKVPIIAICNDKSNPKMKPLMATCFQMTFKRCVTVLLLYLVDTRLICRFILADRVRTRFDRE